MYFFLITEQISKCDLATGWHLRLPELMWAFVQYWCQQQHCVTRRKQMLSGVGKLYLLDLWMVEKHHHFFSSPSPLNSWDPWHWRRKWGFSELFQTEKWNPDNTFTPSFTQVLFKTSQEIRWAITFSSSTISPVLAALLQNTLWRLQVVSYSKLQVIKTPSAPWQKTKQNHQKPLINLSSFPPSKSWQTEVQNQTPSLWRHLTIFRKLFMSQELASITFPLKT